MGRLCETKCPQREGCDFKDFEGVELSYCRHHICLQGVYALLSAMSENADREGEWPVQMEIWGGKGWCAVDADGEVYQQSFEGKWTAIGLNVAG